MFKSTYYFLGLLALLPGLVWSHGLNDDCDIQVVCPDVVTNPCWEDGDTRGMVLSELTAAALIDLRATKDTYYNHNNVYGWHEAPTTHHLRGLTITCKNGVACFSNQPGICAIYCRMVGGRRMGEDSSSSKDDDEKKKKNGKKNGHKKPKKAEEDTNSEEEEEGTEDIEEEEDEEEEEETTDADIETATSNELELEPVSTEVVPSGRVVHTEHHDLSYLLRNFPLTEEQGKCLEGVRCVLKYVTK